MGKRAGAATAVAAIVLAGCSGGGDGKGDGGDGGEASASATPAAEVRAGGTVGPPGSVCELPLTFDIAEEWEPDAVDVEGAGEFIELLQRGPVTGVCEIDAKPAGNIGFIRVYTGEPGDDDAKAVLSAFVADEPGAIEERYTSFTAAGVPAGEVTYRIESEFYDEPNPEQAFALITPDGPVVVQVGGLDREEHEAMLPAYELAKRTARITD
ncbi:lipoprotein [Streptomyces sp. NPDC059477]|uniref:lipoprotein n=1 Tax=Streptomyces sp. NPDC059477 TaxID=3346847 RepID=UPI003699D501